MGQKYAMALSSSMKYMNVTKSVKLPSNNMGKKGSKAIIKSLNKNIKHLDLSKNNIGLCSVNALKDWFNKTNLDGNKCHLRVLNLSANGLSDKALCILAESLVSTNPTHLKELDLSKN